VLGGNGERMLRLAARHADVMAFTGARHTTGHGERGEPTGVRCACGRWSAVAPPFRTHDLAERR
jgi:alkanesulfonate monooxygenase SsuD/methylene tetrahydromethanopterin reductase-like flavin-dependent oxidoreductase (luciferase family)